MRSKIGRVARRCAIHFVTAVRSCARVMLGCVEQRTPHSFGHWTCGQLGFYDRKNKNAVEKNNAFKNDLNEGPGGRHALTAGYVLVVSPQRAWSPCLRNQCHHNSSLDVLAMDGWELYSGAITTPFNRCGQLEARELGVCLELVRECCIWYS